MQHRARADRKNTNELAPFVARRLPRIWKSCAAVANPATGVAGTGCRKAAANERRRLALATITLYLRGDQIGTYGNASSTGNGMDLVLTLTGVQPLGTATDVFRVVITQVNSGETAFRNGQWVSVYSYSEANPNGTLLHSYLNPQDDMYQGRASGAARHLVDDMRVRVVPMPMVEYLHIAFDHHDVVCAEGMLAESLLPGPMALSALPREAREEIEAIFPELAPGMSRARVAALCLTGREAAVLRLA